MHEHWTTGDWIRTLTGPGVEEHAVVTECPRAREAWVGNLGAWMVHVAGCPHCRGEAEARRLVPAERLDCPGCRRALDVVVGCLDEGAHFEPAVAWEIERAQELWADLAPRPVHERVALARFDRRFHQWGFVQEVLREARGAWHDDPGRAREHALLAVAVAQRLPEETYHPRWVADLQGRALGYLGNAYRLLASFGRAEQTFALARERLRLGVGSPQAEAGIASLRASLLIDRHRHRDALALLYRVEGLVSKVGDQREIACVALKRARVLKALGHPGEAGGENARAAAKIDPARDPLLELIARQNSVDYLAAAGRIDRGWAVFEDLPPVVDRTLRIRRSWVEGHLLRAEQRFGEAREAYERARAAFATAGLPYDADLVARDIAACRKGLQV